MYNTRHICRYNDTDVFIESDKINDETKDQIMNILYRNDFLHIFEIDDYDEIHVNKVLDNLYLKLKSSQEFVDIMKKVSKLTCMVEDEVLGLMVLYSFDYLNITHMCVSEFLETGTVSNEKLVLLNNVISK